MKKAKWGNIYKSENSDCAIEKIRKQVHGIYQGQKYGRVNYVPGSEKS